MRYIEDYEDKELLDLSDDDTQRLIDLECARTGVELLPDLGPPPVAPDVKATVKGYEVVVSVLLSDHEEAMRLVQALRELNLMEAYYMSGHYAYGSPEGLRQVSDKDTPIREKMFWETDVYNEHKRELEVFEKESKLWKQMKENHGRIAKQYAAARNLVWDAINDAREEKEDRDQLIRTFAQYKELAEGNEEIALGFILKTEKWDQGFVLETLNPELPEPEGTENGGEENDQSGDKEKG